MESATLEDVATFARHPPSVRQKIAMDAQGYTPGRERNRCANCAHMKQAPMPSGGGYQVWHATVCTLGNFAATAGGICDKWASRAR